ncbi:hypothetical protein Tco_0714117 [Tanacetum coccineum]
MGLVVVFPPLVVTPLASHLIIWALLIALDNPYTSNSSSLNELFLSLKRSLLVVLNSLMNASIYSCSLYPSSINLFTISSIVNFLLGSENWNGLSNVPDMKDIIQSKVILTRINSLKTSDMLSIRRIWINEYAVWSAETRYAASD